MDGTGSLEELKRARPMRAATYSIALAAGDQGVAECVVNYFGPGQGGGVDANVERWRGQVLGADGKPAAAKIDKRTARGMPITLVDASGTYTGMGGPMMAGSKPAAGYRLIGRHRRRTGRQRVFQADGSRENDRGTAEEFRAAAGVDPTRQVTPWAPTPSSRCTSRSCSSWCSAALLALALAARHLAPCARRHLGRTHRVQRMDLPADAARESAAPRARRSRATREISSPTTFCRRSTRTDSRGATSSCSAGSPLGDQPRRSTRSSSRAIAAAAKDI